MNKCVFLSMDSLDGFMDSDEELYEPMKDIGWDVEEISWRRTDVDWNDYDVVLIRSTWDYVDDPVQFLSVLERINESSARLENSLHIVKWNIKKTYLRDLEEKGVSCVPTLWRDRFDVQNSREFFDRLGVEEIIIKPILSAGAKDTYRLTYKSFEEKKSELMTVFDEQAFMVQPFVREIIDPGEFSLFYFAGEHSHTVQKKPKENDFRVQEEYGGILSKIEPEAEMSKAAEKVLGLVDEDLLYARVDLVPFDGEYRLMELELIEPDLYFYEDEEAANRFANAFERWMKDRMQPDS